MEVTMSTYKLLILCLFSQTLLAGEWSITLQNRETEKISVLHPTARDYFFPERANYEWKCLLKKEKMTFDNQGLPTLGRLIACATRDGEVIGGTLVCNNFSFDAKIGDDSHILMPEACTDELELKELGATVPNIKIIIKYEWWK